MTGAPSGLFAECLERADIVIVAMGYETNTVPLLGPTGTKLEWAISSVDGQVRMDDFTAQPYVHLEGPGRPPSTLPNLYALGLGYGLFSGGAMKTGDAGVRLDGIGGYHTWIGDLVFRGMQKAEVPHGWKDIALDIKVVHKRSSLQVIPKAEVSHGWKDLARYTRSVHERIRLHAIFLVASYAMKRRLTRSKF